MKLKAYLSNPLFSQSTRGNDRLYTGREYDGETGLYYYRAREYSPELGRFLQRDPVGQSDQINLYTYVGNSPVMGRDPSGEWIVPLGIAIVAAAAFTYAYYLTSPESSAMVDKKDTKDQAIHFAEQKKK